MPAPTAADAIRILIATDSHVGYGERDPIRKDDSWRSFEEVMKLAKTKDVDMVLLAGDLFHENKPSRKSMYQVMRALRLYCLGDKPCELEMLSDPGEVFGGSFNHVNYEDPDINVAVPVFSIHGNHDDPSGDGHFCALDILQVAGLINYFGRTPESDNIEVKPILLQKGQTKLALYGISNVRDERLFRTFREGRVKFFKPDLQKDDWFNLIAVHQNHHAHSDTNYLPENFLPEFLDLVVWGHEHECEIEPRQNPESGFHVMQPGSSVATSLVPGEAKAKHVAIVTVIGREFNVEKHRITSVRPFVTREIQLSTDPRFKGLEKVKDNKNQVSTKLKEIVLEMIQQATDEWCEIQEEPYDEVPKPLIRLKVEYSSPTGKFEVENPQRFSNMFVDKVANVNDVVQFHMKKTGLTSKKAKGEMPEESTIAAMNNENLEVEELVRQFLEAQSLKILPQAPFTDAVNQFVVKEDKNALDAFVAESLADQVKEMLLLELDAEEEEDLQEAMEIRRAALEAAFEVGTARKKRKVVYLPEPEDWDSRLGDWEEQPEAMVVVTDDEASAPTKGKGRSGRSRTFDSDDDDDMGSVISAPAKKAPAKRAPAKAAAKVSAKRAPAKTTKAPAKIKPAPKARGGRKKVVESEEEEEAVDDDDSDVVMLDEAPASRKPQPKRVATARGASTRQTQLTFSQPGKSTKKVSEDEISDDDDAFAPTVSQQSSRKRY